MFTRNCRKMSVLAKQLRYETHGEPTKVLSLVEQNISAPGKNEVLVKVLIAPINPVDVNVIQGKYPMRPQLPAIGGNELVGRVAEVGEDVKNLRAGDHVIPFMHVPGSWSTFIKYPADYFLRISKNIDLPVASQFTVNPCTAYRMLKDYVNLGQGDTVIQNGANSAVGQAVFQLCKHWNIKCIGVVRNRPEINDLKSFLKGLGADEVLTEEEIQTTTLFKQGVYEKPKLALDCVGGKSALNISKHLSDGGVMVTYGGMSREPVIVPTGFLIFKDISYKGFSIGRWTMNNAFSEERNKMNQELLDLMECGKLIAPPHELVPLRDYKRGVEHALSSTGYVGKKMLLALDESLVSSKL